MPLRARHAMKKTEKNGNTLTTSKLIYVASILPPREGIFKENLMYYIYFYMESTEQDKTQYSCRNVRKGGLGNIDVKSKL